MFPDWVGFPSAFFSLEVSPMHRHRVKMSVAQISAAPFTSKVVVFSCCLVYLLLQGKGLVVFSRRGGVLCIGGRAFGILLID